MIRFHFCRQYLKDVQGHVFEQKVKSKFEDLAGHNRLVNSGVVKNYGNGLYYLKTYSPKSRIIIHKAEVDGADVHFVRCIYTNSNIDYYFGNYIHPSVKSGVWLDENPLLPQDVEDYRQKVLEEENFKLKSAKSKPPVTCSRWVDEFKLSFNYQVFETAEWVGYALSEVDSAKMRDRDVKLFAQLIDNLFDDSESSELRKTVISTHDGVKIVAAQNNFVGVVYSSFDVSGNLSILLYNGAHLASQSEHWEKICSVSGRLSAGFKATFDEVSRVAYKAYPKWTLRNDDLWFAIQKNDEFSNLSLTQDQLDFFRGFRFPTYINGQAGSGKSTMLYYLFSNAFYSKCSEENVGDVLFLTENKHLLEHSRRSVFDLLSNNPEFDGLTIDQIVASENHFSTFTDFLLNLIPIEDRDYFPLEKMLNFSRFKDLYLNSHLHDSVKRKFTAEEAWFTIITYIYGYDSNNRITSETYETVVYSKSQKIPKQTFGGIEESVLPFYEKLIYEQGYWDRLKLIRYLEANETTTPKYSVVVCDEAQDFCRVELRFILKLSEFLQYDLSDVSQIPIIIAGDPNQTVNPTGFREREMTEMLHKELHQESSFNFNKDDSVYNPKYNYRSKQPVVTLANFIQYYRKKEFDVRMVSPQVPKRPDSVPEPIPNYFLDFDSLEEPGLKHELIEKIRYKIFIVPVDEDSKSDYIIQNKLLSEIENFEIKTSVEAKGAEYEQVVIYGFGEYYLNEFGSLNASSSMVGANDAFRRSYFFNKLYVAVTRAQKELVIIDSKDSEKGFWRELVNDSDVTGSNWSVLNDLRDSTIAYKPGSLKGLIESSREDALTNAMQDKRQGEYDQNPARMLVAANQFYKIGEKEEYYICYALAYEFKLDWLKAAEYYLRPELNRETLAEAARCLFNGRHLDTLREEIGTSLRTKEQDVRLIVSKMVDGPGLGPKEISTLFEKKTTLRKLIQRIRWRDEVVDQLIQLTDLKLSPGQLHEVASIFEVVAKNEDSHLWRKIGDIRFKLQDFQEAIEAWDRCDLMDTSDYAEAKVKFYQVSGDLTNETIWLTELVKFQKSNESIQHTENQILKNFDSLGQSQISPYLRLATYPTIAKHRIDSDFHLVTLKLEQDFEQHLNVIIDLYFDLIGSRSLIPQLEDYLLLRLAKVTMKDAQQHGYSANAWLPNFNKSWRDVNKELSRNHNEFTMAEIEQIPNEPQEIPLIPPKHIKNIDVSGFRRFESLELTNLGLYNLIVGDNNIGKTTVLEALLFDSDKEACFKNLAYAFAERKNISRIKDDALAEERFLIPRDFVDSYRRNNTDQDIEFLIYEGRSSWTYEICKLTTGEVEALLDQKGGLDCNDYAGFVKDGTLSYLDIPILLKNLKPHEALTYPLVPFGKGYSHDLAFAYSDKIDRVKSVREEFLQNMTVFIPKISRIMVDTERGSVLIEEEDSETSKELHQYGEGANKLFRILVQITLNKGGRVLVDEIDAGIHHTRFTEFWSTLLTFAQLNNVQLFATTHNLECIKYFKELLADESSFPFQKDSRVISLKKLPNNSIKAYTRLFEEFEYELDNDIELRGE